MNSVYLSFADTVTILLYLKVLENDNSFPLFTGVTIGAACTLKSVEEVMRKAVADLPAHKTEIFQAVLEQLRWFAGPQIRNVAVSDSGAPGAVVETSV